jgi:tetratricopeptide (TPR) repeat protein
MTMKRMRGIVPWSGNGIVSKRLASVVVVISVPLLGCATRGRQNAPSDDLVRAEQLVTAGCYRCLEEAFAVYERQLQDTRRPSVALRHAAFETAVLLVLRQRELGIPSDVMLQKARSLEDLPSRAPGHLPPKLLVALADLTPGDIAAADPDDVASRNTRERREELAALRSQPAHTAQPPSVLESYLALAFDCNDAQTRRGMQGEELRKQFEAVPLLRYRVAACGFGPRDSFSIIRQADPRWVETAFFDGRAEASGRRPNLRAAIDLLTIARDAIPESAAVSLTLAHAQRGYGDLSPTTNVYTLAGVIAYDRKQLDVARELFLQARKADSSNCTAHSYFALVGAAQNNWPVATPVFSQAMTCFASAAADAQTELEAIARSDFDEVFKARLIAQQQKTIVESELKAAQAAYNAARGLVREGRRDEAIAHLQLALRHPEVKAQAQALQKLIEH